jgi:alpha-ketoglutarate-dependent taurine dioxygenase
MSMKVLVENDLPAITSFDHLKNPVDFAKWYNDNRSAINADILQNGAVLFRGVKMEDPSDFDQAVRNVEEEFTDYIDVSYQRRKLTSKVYISTEYDRSLPIKLHNELSYASRWPSRLFFGCLVNAPVGGETSIADSAEIVTRMDPSLLSELKTRKIRYVRNLHGGVGLGPSWQETFKTEKPSDVEAFCKEEMMKFQWGDDGSLKLEAIRPPVRTHPITNREVWFSVAELYHPYHFDKEYYESLLDLVDGDVEKLPLYSSYGDGTAIPNNVIQEIINTVEAEMKLVRWNCNELLLVDNMRCSHGRMPYSGDRKIVVFLCK